MINKLRIKVTFIVLFAISIPLLFVITFYTISFYNNVINLSSRFIDRFFEVPQVDVDNKRENIFEISQMEGIYSISISNNDIIKKSDNVTDEIEEYVSKIVSKKSVSGIVGNYIYKKRVYDMKDNSTTIILVESSSEINKIKIVVISSIIVSGLGLVLIYILSKKIAGLIVKPVEETFSKQIDFISDASHELKTPLAVIQANADVLEGEIGNNKWLTYIQKETDNMGKLISELLLLTKIESVDKLRKPEKFNMSDYIELVVATFESMAFERKVKVETKIQKGVVTDSFSKDDIEHVLSTLIDNAIKHTKEKNKVIVEFEKNKDNICIYVKNKGEEIPVSEREKIFDRFYRIDKSRNRNEKRYGLGLSIAKSTVLKNNGIIIVDYKDGYTIFKVELPI